MKRAWLAAAWFGCKAESLGVEVPRGGPDAIRMEDLRRDAFLLEAQKKGRGVGEPRPAAGWATLAERLRQMKTVPAFGRSFRAEGDARVICSRKDGRSDRVRLVAVEDNPENPPASTAGMAMLISLAKAYDTRHPPEQTVLFCAWDGPEGFAAFARAPPVPLRRIEKGWMLGGPERPVGDTTVLAPHALDVARTVDGLNFERLQQATRTLDAVVRAGVSASP